MIKITVISLGILHGCFYFLITMFRCLGKLEFLVGSIDQKICCHSFLFSWLELGLRLGHGKRGSERRLKIYLRTGMRMMMKIIPANRGGSGMDGVFLSGYGDGDYTPRSRFSPLASLSMIGSEPYFTIFILFLLDCYAQYLRVLTK